MVDTIGLPTVFSTHSAADLKWPELAHLSCPEEPDSSASQSKALIKKNSWFSYDHLHKFIDVF